MPGSESSARDEALPDALRLTVYRLDGAAVATGADRTLTGRVKMLLVLLVCAAPVVVSYLAYFGWRPQAQSNYGTLIVPPRPLPPADLRAIDGSVIPAAQLRGQWLLVVVAGSSCLLPCERLLYAQRQLREMLGRDRDRVEKLWLVGDEGRVAAPLLAALSASPATTVLRISPEALTGWLEPEPGRHIDEHLYLVDPKGDWMMRFPVDFDPAKVRRDLDRLLRASASWDRPGR